MKKFIIKTFLISLPIILIGISIELFISFYPNTFNTKAKYLTSNLENIEILFLGSSHIQDGINPEFIDVPSANVAYAQQDYQLDNALYFKYIDRLKNIDKVVIELDYHSLEEKNDQDYFGLLWYYRYYDINLDDFKAYNKLTMFYSNPKFFTNYLKRTLNPFNEKNRINKFGFMGNDSDVFKRLNFDEKIIAETSIKRLKNRHTSVSVANFKSNKEILRSLIEDCWERNIQVIILKTPQYVTYRNNYNLERLERRDHLIDSLSTIRKIKIWDYEEDERFGLTDFKNDDHLNSKGAEKLSKIINEELKNERKLSTLPK